MASCTGAAPCWLAGCTSAVRAVASLPRSPRRKDGSRWWRCSARSPPGRATCPATPSGRPTASGTCSRAPRPAPAAPPRGGAAGWPASNSGPAIVQVFAEEAAAAGACFPALRTVLLSGDWIPVTLPGRIRAIAPNARVVSLGGATEASIWSICYPVDRDEPGRPSIPYGRPLANQSLHVLDGQGRDAPDWVPGQLYIGGAGVALGYLNHPAKTAPAFAAHPRTGDRPYPTGDPGRDPPSGGIQFPGRADL